MKSTIKFFDIKQRSKEWDAIRVGKVGGSEAVGLSTPARMKTLIPKKIAEIQTGEQEFVFTTTAMQDGIDAEPIARQFYEKENFTTIVTPGYVTSSKYKYLGLSVDGLEGINMNSCGSSETAIEIKCPLPKAHVEIIITGDVPTAYKPQIAQIFLILENVDKVVFVSYNEKVTAKPYYQIEVLRENFQDEISKMEKNYFIFETKMDECLKLFC